MGIEDLPASFTTGQARAAGVAPSTLYRMRERGEVVELSRGVWRRADAPPIASTVAIDRCRSVCPTDDLLSSWTPTSSCPASSSRQRQHRWRLGHRRR